MARYCLDASFLLAWLVPGNASSTVESRWRSFTGEDDLIAPSLLRAECTSVLARRVHSRAIDESDGRLQIARILRLPLSIVDRGPLYLRAFDIARALGWSKAYDALYIAIAEAEAAELLTLDHGLCGGARRLGVRAALINA